LGFEAQPNLHRVIPLAEEDTLPANNFNSIGINTFPDANSTELLPNTLEAMSTSQITINPNGAVSLTNPLKVGVSQIDIGENNIFHRTSSKVNVATITTSAKTGISEIGSSQIRSIDTNTIKSGSEETSTTEIGIAYKTSIKGRTNQVDAAQVSPIQMSYGNFSEGEISSPSSIEIQDVLFF
jgi:hypothetical protein